MIAVFAMTVALHLSVAGQNYDVNDTVTEYPLKGTYYHNKFEGRKTASGEIFNQNLFTAAHWKIKMGTHVLVTNKNTGLQVIVKINDRCPKHGVLDMTHRAANAIGIKGSQPVSIRILPPGYEEQCTAQDALFDSVNSRFATGTYALGGSASEPDASANANPNLKKGSKASHTAGNKRNSSSSQGERYNLILGTVQSHGEAFEMIQKLPEPYQERTLIDSTDSETFVLILEVNLEKRKAQELNRALKHTFNNCQITPSK